MARTLDFDSLSSSDRTLMSPQRRTNGTQIQYGFSLVEFMTSAALTLILLGGVFAMF